MWKDVSKHKRVAIFSVFAALFVLSSAFGGLGTFTNVREHNGRVSITIGAPHEVRITSQSFRSNEKQSLNSKIDLQTQKQEKKYRKKS